MSWGVNGSTRVSKTDLLSAPDWQVTHLADLDGDGQADLVWQNEKTGQITAWLMNGNAAAEKKLLLTAQGWRVTHTGDFNGDGKADLLWLNDKTGQTVLWLMSGLTRLTSQELLSNPVWRVSQVADLDGDGKTDLIWSARQIGQTAAWLMDGVSRRSGATLLVAQDWAVTHVADLDRDGKADLLWHNAVTGQTSGWLMDGLTRRDGALLLTDRDWRVRLSEDLDGDGRADLVWENTKAGQTAAWLMNGLARVSGATLLAIPGWQVTHAVDLDADGKADLLWYNPATGQTASWLMNGLQSYSRVELLSDREFVIGRVSRAGSTQALKVSAVVKPGVKVFTSAAGTDVSAMGSGRYLFSAPPKEVKVGAAIVIDQRPLRVISVSPVSGRYQVDTEPVALEEILSDFDVRGSLNLSSATFRPFDEDELLYSPLIDRVTGLGGDTDRARALSAKTRRITAEQTIKPRAKCSNTKDSASCDITVSDPAGQWSVTGKLGIRQFQTDRLEVGKIQSVLNGQFNTFGDLKLSLGKGFAEGLPDFEIPLARIMIPVTVGPVILGIEVPLSFIAKFRSPVGLTYNIRFDRQVKFVSSSAQSNGNASNVTSAGPLSGTEEVGFVVQPQVTADVDVAREGIFEIGMRTGLLVRDLSGLAKVGVKVRSVVKSRATFKFLGTSTPQPCWKADSWFVINAGPTSSSERLNFFLDSIGLEILNLSLDPLSFGSCGLNGPSASCSKDLKVDLVYNWKNVRQEVLGQEVVTVKLDLELFSAVRGVSGTIETLNRWAGSTFGPGSFEAWLLFGDPPVNNKPRGAETRELLPPSGASKAALEAFVRGCRADMGEAGRILLPAVKELESCPETGSAPVFSLEGDLTGDVPISTLKVPLRRAALAGLAQSGTEYRALGFEKSVDDLGLPNYYLDSRDPDYADPMSALLVGSDFQNVSASVRAKAKEHEKNLECYRQAFSRIKAAAKKYCARTDPLHPPLFCVSP